MRVRVSGVDLRMSLVSWIESSGVWVEGLVAPC